ATISVSPATNTLVKGDSVRLTPTAYNSSGQPVAAAFTWSVTSGTALASVSQTGWVKALGAGTATVAASSAGKTGTATINITAPTTTPTPPPPGTVPSIPPTLPLSSVNTSWRAPTGKSIAVHAGDNLQNALNAAQRGDEIVIDAGATFTGSFLLPTKTGTSANGWITVRTSALSSLPPSGTRINYAQHASAMPKLVANTVAEVLKTHNGSSGWRIVGIEMTVIPNLTWVHNGLVLLGDGSGIQKTLSQVPTDIILDRVYIHGQPNVSLKRCVALNSASTAIIDSQLLECHGRGFDSQAILGWNGPGPYLIQNNKLEGAGEVIMFGGVTPTIPNLVPSDITIRRNYLYRPMSWKGVWTVKNLFELKNAQRVLVEGNVMENNWVDGQVGYALVFGSADTGYSWCVVQDVMFRHNQVHNSAGGVNLFEHYGQAIPMKRVALLSNLFTGIGASGLGTNGRMFQFTDGLDDIWIESNTGFAPVTYMTFNAYTKPMNRFTYRNNIGGGAQYNLHSPEGMGQAALNKHLTSPYVFAGNLLVSSPLLMPTSNAYTSSITSVGFVNPIPIGGIWSLSSLSLYLSIGMGGTTPGLSWLNFIAQLANVRL
ncbi:MAG: Ig-like domain-containing protein, partial [Gemmatimonadaceae bacterium]